MLMNTKHKHLSPSQQFDELLRKVIAVPKTEVDAEANKRSSGRRPRARSAGNYHTRRGNDETK